MSNEQGVYNKCNSIHLNFFTMFTECRKWQNAMQLVWRRIPSDVCYWCCLYNTKLANHEWCHWTDHPSRVPALEVIWKEDLLQNQNVHKIASTTRAISLLTTYHECEYAMLPKGTHDHDTIPLMVSVTGMGRTGTDRVVIRAKLFNLGARSMPNECRA